MRSRKSRTVTFVRFTADQAGMIAVNRAVEALARISMQRIVPLAS